MLLSAGCSRSTVEFEIDNPTDAPLTLSVDQQVHTLPPHTSMPWFWSRASTGCRARRSAASAWLSMPTGSVG
ncbi:hypothetical protein NMB32_08395 [Stenotrophomonas sp. CD2]|nr:hypothetical protein NMB32_08395 [Stenotrophomonas sp. CD2]